MYGFEMSWLPAAIASFTAGGASLGRGGESVGRIFACCPGVSGSGPPTDGCAPGRRRRRGRLARRGRRDLAEQVAGAGVGRGGDGDVADAPGVLGGAALPVVDVDVAADDRAAGVAGVERVVVPNGLGVTCSKLCERDHRRVDRDLVRRRAGGQVQAGGGDAAAVHRVPRRAVGGRDPRRRTRRQRAAAMATWQGGFPAPANSTTGEITIMNAPAASQPRQPCGAGGDTASPTSAMRVVGHAAAPLAWR